jgi:hypothetical protein
MKGTEEGLSLELSTNQKGAIAETAVAHVAIKLGIDVYRPVAEGGRFDLIFGLGPKLLRIQCKWAVRLGDVVSVRLQTSRRGRYGKLIQKSYGEDEIDGVAAYCEEIDECYFLPVSLVARRRQIYLRLRPSKNNQRLKVNFASRYKLGAIAQLGERLGGTQEVAGSSPASSTEVLFP